MAYTTIKKPSDYFNTKLYTGDGTSSRNITGVGFKPDWVWVKERTSTSSHRLCDIVRGATKGLFSNLTNAEGTNSNALLSFDSDGFTIGDNGQVNEDTQTYASWNWLANGAGSANTDGTISSTVSANTTSGFSIVSYTGTGANATVGHGLGVAPSMIIVKNRDNVNNWTVYHGSQGGTKVQWLNLTNATATESGWWNNTDPTTSVFYIGTQNGVNQSGDSMIAYCFADVQGYSKFGSYTGNGSTDGTFVYTGFKPAWVMVKRSDAVDTWTIYDNKRSASGGFNQIDYALDAHSAAVEDASTSYNSIDILSNGYKCRQSNAGLNASGGNYIYMAFAEEPLVGDNPATAR